MNFKMILLGGILLTMTSTYSRDASGLRDLARRYGANGYINNLPLYYGEHEYHNERCSCATKSHTPLPVSKPSTKRTLTRKERETRRQSRKSKKNDNATLEEKKTSIERGFFG